MSIPKITLIGKEYNTSTRLLKSYLEQAGLPFEYLDLEFFPEHWHTIKFYKILSIPVLFIDEHFIVGYEEQAVRTFVNAYYLPESTHEEN